LDFSISNSYAPTFVIGDDSAPSLEYGQAVVEGTLSAYFEDAALITRFLDEVESELEVSVDDPTGANPYTFLFPRIKNQRC
jgi:Ethanolamine utilization protein EutJ (predicted chaperonin)